MYFFAIGELSPSFLIIPVFEAPLADSRRISKIIRVESRRCLKDEQSSQELRARAAEPSNR